MSDLPASDPPAQEPSLTEPERARCAFWRWRVDRGLVEGDLAPDPAWLVPVPPKPRFSFGTGQPPHGWDDEYEGNHAERC